MYKPVLGVLLALSLGCARTPHASSDANTAAVRSAPTHVRLTWLSVTNWLLEAGDTRILLDGYVTRIDRRTVGDDVSSTARATIDRATVERIATEVIPDRRLDWIFVGHAHWDHGFDTPAWAGLTGARIGGARTVCYQAIAYRIPSDRCRALEGGEVIDVSPFVRVRAVRWVHSGDTSDIGRRLRAPLELRAPPSMESGGLRPGVLEDYPNGGGARAYLITVRTQGEPITIFWSNTANPLWWDAPLPLDTTYFRERGIDVSHLAWAPQSQSARDALVSAMRAEGVTSVDVWLGFPSAPHIAQVAGVVRPRAFIPHHWDDFWSPITSGVRQPFTSQAMDAALASMGVRAIVPSNYFDRFRIDSTGVVAEGDAGVRARLGVGGVTR